VVSDQALMRRALFHAARAVGATAPNPAVGAVIVSDDGVVVGQGFHERAGLAHAEVAALDAAGARARGATMYVTLEPCCHTGRTGPCTQRLLEAGVRRVVAATLDPDPRVAGRGIALLRAAGIEVEVGLAEAEARRLNAGYFLAQERGRPLVVVKAAVSRDGAIAARRDRPTAITGPAAARRTQRLRAAVDAVAVGVDTVLADDPRLTARDVVRARPLARVVFDRRLRTPVTARLFTATPAGPVIMITTPEAMQTAADHVAALTAAGAVVVPAASIDAALAALVAQQVHTLLVEGGARLHRALWEADRVDRLHLVVSPRRLGSGAVPLFDGWPVPWARLSRVTAVPCGDDLWMEADVHRDR
jgi:diaminohydroxyphosphoribosylaminopyrimidine deaminase/5-amino-6-(5-phosphoribosylamino)uracil reductase